MATYQDIHRVIKETIQVDADPNKRWSPQKVRFINKENEFYGNFSGGVNAENGLTASNCSLSNVSLSSCKIYDKDGGVIDIEEMADTLSSVNYTVRCLSNRIEHVEEVTIPNLCGYVDYVSSEMSILIDEKVKESKGESLKELSVISSLLQSEISTEQQTRYINDKALSDDIEDIRSKIKGGIVFRGSVNTYWKTGDLECDGTISSLVYDYERDFGGFGGIVRNGYAYVVKGNKRVFGLSTTIGNGDYLFLKIKNDVGQCCVSDLTESNVDVVDAMNLDVYDMISSLSSGVGELSNYIENLTSDYDLSEGNCISVITKVSQNRGLVSLQSRRLTSCDIEGLSNYVTSEINLSVSGLKLDNKVGEGYLISHLSQKDGVISVQTTQILSSYIVGLSDYVNEQIRLSTEAFDSEISSDGKVAVKIAMVDGRLNQDNSVFEKITDKFVEDGKISQTKITNLTSDLFNISSELSTIDRRNRGDVSWMGDFNWTETRSPASELSNFLRTATGRDFDKKLMKGFLYRQPIEQDIVCNSDTRKFKKNDYFLINSDVILSNATFDTFRFIKDYDLDISNLNTRIDNLDVDKISAQNGYIIDSIWENEGKISATTRRLVSSDISYLGDYVQNEISLSVQSISGKYTVEEGKTVQNIIQKNGKLEVTGRDILSSHVKCLSNYVQTEIGLSVSDISSNTTIPKGKIISLLTQENGKVSVLTSDIVSSDVIGLSDYIRNEIENLDVSQISETNKFISKVWETDGKISAETRSITDNDISEGLISQNKINSLTSDLKNISAELSGSYSEISTLSTNFDDLSSDYYDLKSNTFYEFDKETHPHISSMGLIITDEKHPEGEGAHDRYVLTFLSGTLVLQKI